ncbi:hypothetical protein MCBG_02463, partial [Micromonospora sp. M42]
MARGGAGAADAGDGGPAPRAAGRPARRADPAAPAPAAGGGGAVRHAPGGPGSGPVPVGHARRGAGRGRRAGRGAALPRRRPPRRRAGGPPGVRTLVGRRRDGPGGGCAGCAPARRADLLAGWGDPEAALAALAPALTGWVEPQGPPTRRAERQTAATVATTCTDQPERALTVGLLPWLRTGAVTEAARAHVRAYRRHRRERAAFPLLAAHLRFCALGGYLHRGLEVLTEQLPRLDRPADDLSAMEFAAAGALLCGLAAEAGLGGRRIHRPGHGSRPAAEVDVATLGHSRRLATALA